MERKERKFEFKHYEVLDKMWCVDGLKDLRTDKPQSIETQPNLNIRKPKHRSAEGENMFKRENLAIAVTQAEESALGSGGWALKWAETA